MDRETVELWIKIRYPITIISDRYGGTYSGGDWLAFPLEYDEIPDSVNSGDGESIWFWEVYDKPVGKGNTPDEAMKSLLDTMYNLIKND